MVGAGGAARGVFPAILDEAPDRLVVVNRSPERADALATRFAGGPVEACGFGDLGGTAFDIVINATSGGPLRERAPPVPISAFRPGGAGYDMVYAPEPTSFLLWCRAAGASVAVDGAGMLVEQGAASFRSWRGVRPPTARVIEALLAELARATEPLRSSCLRLRLHRGARELRELLEGQGPRTAARIDPAGADGVLVDHPAERVADSFAPMGEGPRHHAAEPVHVAHRTRPQGPQATNADQTRGGGRNASGGTSNSARASAWHRTMRPRRP